MVEVRSMRLLQQELNELQRRVEEEEGGVRR